MQIWLKGSKRFRFPVLPAEYEITSSRGDETVNINAIGEVDLGGNRELKTISFSSFFPKRFDPTYCEYSGLRTSKDSVDIIEAIKEGVPAKLTMTGTPIKCYVRITSFTWGERDGTGDIYFSITMKEHRSISTPSSSVGVDAEVTAMMEAKRPDPPVEPVVEVVVPQGETRSSVARRTTGSASNKLQILPDTEDNWFSGDLLDQAISEFDSNRRKVQVVNGINGATTVHQSTSGRTHGGAVGKSFEPVSGGAQRRRTNGGRENAKKSFGSTTISDTGTRKSVMSGKIAFD